MGGISCFQSFTMRFLDGVSLGGRGLKMIGEGSLPNKCMCVEVMMLVSLEMYIAG